MNLSLQAWAALISTAVLVAIVGGYCVIAPLLERVGARRFERESAMLAVDEQVRWAVYRRTGKFLGDIPPARMRGNDAVMRALAWLTAKVLRLDRKAASRG